VHLAAFCFPDFVDFAPVPSKTHAKVKTHHVAHQRFADVCISDCIVGKTQTKTPATLPGLPWWSAPRKLSHEL
jgi:hypothetical protein